MSDTKPCKFCIDSAPSRCRLCQLASAKRWGIVEGLKLAQRATELPNDYFHPEYRKACAAIRNLIQHRLDMEQFEMDYADRQKEVIEDLLSEGEK